MSRDKTNKKSFWICPNSKCEMIHLDPPVKCANCGHDNKNGFENVIFDNLLAEKRSSRTKGELNSLGFAQGYFTKIIKQQNSEFY